MRLNDSTRSKLFESLDLRPALLLLWQSGKKWTIATTSLTLLQGIVPLLSLYLLKLIVDRVEAAAGGGALAAAPGVDSAVGSAGEIFWLVAAAGAVALLGAALQAAHSYANEAQSLVVADYVLGRLQAKSAQIDLEHYESSAYHDILHLAQREAPIRPRMITDALGNISRNGVSLLAMAGLLFLFHWAIPFVLLVAALPGLVVRLRFADSIYRWHRKSAPDERLARYYNHVLIHDSHAKELRLFNLAGLFMQRFAEVKERLREQLIGIARRRSIAELVAQAGGTVAIFSSLAFIAWRTLQGQISLGDLVMYFHAFQRGQQFLREMLRGLADVYGNNLFLSAFRELLALKPTVVDPPDPTPVPAALQQGIRFDNVEFRYPDSERTALNGISFEIRPGETVALVGHNGAGKTTLVKLLCRLYDPTHGSIQLDGIDLRQFATADLRRQISVVFQDFVHYHMTAKENIWLGNIELPLDGKEVVDAASLAGIDSVLENLPGGYEQMLGKWFDTGEQLSIGQWQKIALARAFLGRGQITILDEPTSALDPQAELDVIERFRRLTEGRTAILVSHRLSTVKMADRIFVLEDGRIVENGPHHELMARQGVYAELFSSQARSYDLGPE